MIIELDVGNSQCKWRLSGAAGVISRGIGLDALADSLHPDTAVEVVRLASVRSAERTAQIADHLRALTSAPVVQARSQARCGAVINGYEEPERLGVDRWLAVVAAWHERPVDTLVVDVGSALTVDLVAASGAHQGGYIVPGPALMAASLLQHTDRVRFTETRPAGDAAPGRSTEQCVTAGALLSCIGAVESVCRSSRRNGTPVEIAICGGYAERLAPLLQERLSGTPLRLCPDLVLDGLAYVCATAQG